MGNATLQDTLTVEVLTPEEAFKRATMFKHSEQTTSAFQKKNSLAAGAASNTANLTFKTKQELIKTVKNANKRKYRETDSNKKQANNRSSQKQWAK